MKVLGLLLLASCATVNLPKRNCSYELYTGRSVCRDLAYYVDDPLYGLKVASQNFWECWDREDREYKECLQDEAQYETCLHNGGTSEECMK